MGQRPGRAPGQGQGPGYGSGPHSPPGGYGDGRDPYGQGGYGDQGYGGQNGYDGRNGWDGPNGYDGRNGQPGQQGRNGSGRDHDDAPKRKKKQQPSAKRRRQLGSDRRTKALPVVPRPVSDGRVAMARLAIIVTVVRVGGYLVGWLLADFLHPGYESAMDQDRVGRVPADRHAADRVGAGLPAEPAGLLLPDPHAITGPAAAVLDEYFDTTTPTLTTIIPSYQEDERVIRNTLLSAALQEYPDKRVVLLIDDPSVPETRQGPRAARGRAGAACQDRAAAGRARRRFAAALAAFEARCDAASRRATAR